jgi:hypothetical protein
MNTKQYFNLELSEYNYLKDDALLLDDVKVKILSSKVVYDSYVRGYRRRYFCKVTFTDKSFNVTFFDSVYNYQKGKKLDKRDVIYSVFLDAKAYSLTNNFTDFCNEFGYEPYDDEGIGYNKKAMKAYNGCKKAFEKVANTFHPKQVALIEDELEELGY